MSMPMSISDLITAVMLPHGVSTFKNDLNVGLPHYILLLMEEHQVRIGIGTNVPSACIKKLVLQQDWYQRIYL